MTELSKFGMLAKAPADRFQNADEVAFALTPYVDADAEAISVVPVSDEYLRWAQGRRPKDQDAVPPDAIGITPELTNFLGWMGKKKIRRKR